MCHSTKFFICLFFLLCFFSVYTGAQIDETVYIDADGGYKLPIRIMRRDNTPRPVLLYSRYNELSPRTDGSEGMVGVAVGLSREPGNLEEVRRDHIRFYHDWKDAPYALNWIVSQPWCNGKILQTGLSYGGATCWLYADHKLPALIAINPQSMNPDFIDQVYRQRGAMTYYMTAAGRYGGPEGSTYQEKWNHMMRLPIINRSSHPLWIAYNEHYTFDDYWKPISLRVDGKDGRLAGITAAMFAESGWWDNYPGAMLKAFSIMRKAGN